MFPESKSAKPIDARWHEHRQDARENSFSINEWSQEEITRWDLDTADITGQDNDRTYTVDRPLNQKDGQMNNGTDIRTLDSR